MNLARYDDINPMGTFFLPCNFRDENSCLNDLILMYKTEEFPKYLTQFSNRNSCRRSFQISAVDVGFSLFLFSFFFCAEFFLICNTYVFTCHSLLHIIYEFLCNQRTRTNGWYLFHYLQLKLDYINFRKNVFSEQEERYGCHETISLLYWIWRQLFSGSSSDMFCSC